MLKKGKSKVEIYATVVRLGKAFLLVVGLNLIRAFSYSYTYILYSFSRFLGERLIGENHSEHARGRDLSLAFQQYLTFIFWSRISGCFSYLENRRTKHRNAYVRLESFL